MCQPIIPKEAVNEGFAFEKGGGGGYWLTSRSKLIAGAILHSLTRNRFPSSTSRPSKETLRFVVGLKSSATRSAALPGTSLALARESDKATARFSSAIVYVW